MELLKNKYKILNVSILEMFINLKKYRKYP